MDADTGEILASELTNADVDDGLRVEPLLDQIPVPLASFITDRAYDQARIYGTIAQRHSEAEVIVPHDQRRC
ncbi:transposase [Sinorhizobium sp. 7-81]|uniref:transposase n=1 Tax=Sinorhizobium sp. 8-89 TaxID=3049089 RepID=UPI0024C2CF3B|nr:transposase [Sinorhizobium sp. 8-89]MDK1494576.1 transposase [Sinorhizobium sp. 8-89]